MRNRIWFHMANIKFKAIFTYECYRLAESLGRYYSLFLSFASATSVAAWAMWKQYPTVWATVVALAQLLHIAKPYVPLIKHDKDFLEMSFSFESLYLESEKLWSAFEGESISNEAAESQFYTLREKELSIEKSHKQAIFPRFKFLTNYAVDETSKALARNTGGTTI